MNIAIAPSFTQREHTWTKFKAFQLKKQFNIQFDEDDSAYKVWGYDGPEVHLCTLYKSSIPDFITSITQMQNDADKLDFETNFKTAANDKVNTREISKLPDSQPFATPSFRTKRDATSEIVEIAPGSSGSIDYTITEERYVHGGKLIVSGNEMGDRFEAEVIDLNGVIPAPYRAAMCENYPTVAKYIESEWMEKSGVHEINTYPLNAKVTANLVLRVTYFTTSAGSNRQVGINYYLTKKL